MSENLMQQSERTGTDHPDITAEMREASDKSESLKREMELAEQHEPTDAEWDEAHRQIRLENWRVVYAVIGLTAATAIVSVMIYSALIGIPLQ